MVHDVSAHFAVNDVYSFDPNAKVNLDDFVDIIGRNFRQPEEALASMTRRRRTCGAHDVASRFL